MDERLKEAAYNRSSAFVTMHPSHDSAVFDVRTASIIRDALANQEERLIYRPLWVVLKVDDGWAVAWHNISCSRHGCG